MKQPYPLEDLGVNTASVYIATKKLYRHIFRYLHYMKWMLFVGFMFSAMLVHGQDTSAQRYTHGCVLISKTYTLTMPVSIPLTIYTTKGIHFYKAIETPYDHTVSPLALCTHGYQPIFCAVESKLTQAFKIPIKVRLDDRRYDFR